ncbi:MAG: metallophosphoesterase [Variovorax sp.]
MTTLLHISDTHFGTEMPQVLAALERLVQAEVPALVVLSGDITQRATVAQFRAARAFADRLATPVWLSIPGNHDIPLFDLAERLTRPYSRYSDAFGPNLEPVFESDDWLVQCVNTTRWYRQKNGEVSPRQIERVAQGLAKATPRQLRVVVVHQPVCVSRAEDLTNRLGGADAALARWSDSGADLILGGHIHLPYALPVGGASEATPSPTIASASVPVPASMPTPAPDLWVVQAGTAVSARVRAGAPNSVNLLRYDAAQPGRRTCKLERWDFVLANTRFEAIDIRDLPLRQHVALPARSPQAGHGA